MKMSKECQSEFDRKLQKIFDEIYRSSMSLAIKRGIAEAKKRKK